MLPSKSMMEYMTEMQRLFPRPEIEDSTTRFPFTSDQPSFQSTMVNRSSSSTDSTSPESYPDLSFRSSNCRSLMNPRLQDTPFSARPQRAIVGRKILGTSHQTARPASPGKRLEKEVNFWQHDESLSVTSPGNTIQAKNFFYELFPTESRVLESKTAIKSEPEIFDISPNFRDKYPSSNHSPSSRYLSNLSPISQQCYRSQNVSNQTVPVSIFSPTWSNSSLGTTIPSQRQLSFMSNTSSPHHVPNYQNFGACLSADEIAPAKMCTFCRKNGETPIVYMTHSVKEQVGNKNVVTCPILRSHVCATCGASGDNAHTITYCPVLRSHNNGKPLQSTTITLKNTRIKSNGRRRY